MFPAEITTQEVILAVIASVGGSVIRYAIYLLNEEQDKFRLHHFFIDCVIATFLGFFVFLFNIDALEMQYSMALLINCIVGYLGSRIFDIGTHLLYKRLGIHDKFETPLSKDIGEKK